MQDDNSQPGPINPTPPMTPPDPYAAAPQPVAPVPTPMAPPAPVAPSAPTPFSPFGAPPDALSSAPSPMGTPTPAPTPTATYTPPTPTGGSKKKLIIIIGIIIVLLVAAGIAAFLLLGSNKSLTNADGSTKDASSIPASSKQSVAVTKLGELNQVCGGKKISNAPALSTPNKVMPFVGDAQGNWNLYIYSLTENTRFPKTTDEANVVACAVPDETTATAAKSCSPTNASTNQPVSIDYKGVTYDLTFYAAQTGEKISSSKIIATNETCPLYAVNPGTLYAIPDPAVAGPAFNDFYAAN